VDNRRHKCKLLYLVRWTGTKAPTRETSGSLATEIGNALTRLRFHGSVSRQAGPLDRVEPRPQVFLALTGESQNYYYILKIIGSCSPDQLFLLHHPRPIRHGTRVHPILLIQPEPEPPIQLSRRQGGGQDFLRVVMAPLAWTRQLPPDAHPFLGILLVAGWSSVGRKGAQSPGILADLFTAWTRPSCLGDHPHLLITRPRFGDDSVDGPSGGPAVSAPRPGRFRLCGTQYHEPPASYVASTSCSSNGRPGRGPTRRMPAT